MRPAGAPCPPSRNERLREAVCYLACSPRSGENAVAAARALLTDFAPKTRARAPLDRAQELLQPFAKDREVQAALAVLAALLPSGPPQPAFDPCFFGAAPAPRILLSGGSEAAEQ